MLSESDAKRQIWFVSITCESIKYITISYLKYGCHIIGYIDNIVFMELYPLHSNVLFLLILFFAMILILCDINAFVPFFKIVYRKMLTYEANTKKWHHC